MVTNSLISRETQFVSVAVFKKLTNAVVVDTDYINKNKNNFISIIKR